MFGWYPWDGCFFFRRETELSGSVERGGGRHWEEQREGNCSQDVICERRTNKNKTKSNNNRTDEVYLLMPFMNGCDVSKKGWSLTWVPMVFLKHSNLLFHNHGLICVSFFISCFLWPIYHLQMRRSPFPVISKNCNQYFYREGLDCENRMRLTCLVT